MFELSRSHEGRQPPDTGWRSECGARGRRLVTAVLGRLGHQPAGTMTGVRGARCKRGRRRRSEARRFGRLSREAWPEAEPLGCVSPSGESRRGTPEGVLSLPRGWGSAAARKAAVVTEQRLTAFRFLFLYFRSPD